MAKRFSKVFWLVCLLVASLLCNIILLAEHSSHKNGITSDTIRVTIIDTIPHLFPIPVDSVVLRYEAQFLPVKRDTAMQIGCTDSVQVLMPITQKQYNDSSYTAWVSGYKPSLDSIYVYPRHDVVTITNTIRLKPKRWGIGLNVGYGITPKNGMQPYIGVGVSCNLFGL